MINNSDKTFFVTDVNNFVLLFEFILQFYYLSQKELEKKIITNVTPFRIIFVTTVKLFSLTKQNLFYRKRVHFFCFCNGPISEGSMRNLITYLVDFYWTRDALNYQL